MSNLVEGAGTVVDKEGFAKFVAALVDDLAKNPDGWENDSLERFLGGLAGFTQELDGYFRNRGETVPDEPSWALLAQMLLAARIYE